MIKVGDTVRLKGDDREWIVVGTYLALGTHRPEARIEMVGEAWQRTKIVPVADLTEIPPDLEDWPA